MSTVLSTFLTAVAQVSEEAAEAEGEEVFGVIFEFSSLVLALVAFYFAVRILPSIGRDVRKRSGYFSVWRPFHSV